MKGEKKQLKNKNVRIFSGDICDIFVLKMTTTQYACWAKKNNTRGNVTYSSTLVGLLLQFSVAKAIMITLLFLMTEGIKKTKTFDIFLKRSKKH